MKKNRIKKLFAVLLAGITLFSACSQKDADNKYATLSDVEFWSAYSSEKVLQDNVSIYDSIKKAPIIDVTAIRGEEEAMQIIMTSSDKPVKEYDVILSDLECGEEVFDKENIKVYHERYIFVGQGAEYYTESGYYPDCLVPFDKVKEVEETGFAANNNQGLYISFDVPENQPSGEYTGSMEIAIDGESKNIPITLNVSSLVIGEETHVQSSFLNEWYFYRGELDTTEEIFDVYNKFLFDYRLGCNAVTVYTSDVKYYAEKVCEYAAIDSCPGYNIPWFNKDYLNSGYRIYDHYPNPNGITDRELNTQHSYDVDKLILYFETIAYEGLKRNVDPFKKAFVYGWDEPDLTFQDAAEIYIKEWSYIVKQCKNIVIERLKTDTTIASIEILPQIIESLGNVPHLVVSSVYFSYDIDTELEDSVYCPYFSRLGSDGLRDRFRHNEEDYQLWWYGCVAPDYPYPTYHIDDNVLSARVESWMKADYDIQGNLYWATCLYAEDSVNGVTVYPEDFYSGNAARTLATNGEGFLVYPGRKYGIEGPIPSIRIEQIRDGLEEYEMLYSLSNVYKTISNKTGENFSEDKFMRYIYDQLYSGTQVGTTAENFEQVRSLLIGVCELAQCEANVCITNVTVGGGAYTFDVYANANYKLKQSGKEVTDKRAVNGGYIYTISIVPSKGDTLSLSIDTAVKTHTFNMDFGSSSQSYDAVYAYNNGIVKERYLGVDTQLVDARTVNPKAGETEKYLRIDLSEATSTIYHDFIIVDKNVVNKLSAADNRLSITLYNATDEDINTTLAFEYGNNLGRYRSWSSWELKPGLNEISLSNMESLKWHSIKYINSVRLIVGKENDPACSLYFVDMSVYQK